MVGGRSPGRVQVGNKPWWLGRLCLGTGNVLATAAQERGKKGAEQEVKLEETSPRPEVETDTEGVRKVCSWQSRDSSEAGVRKLPDGGPFQYRNPVKRSLARTCCQPSRLRRRCGKLSSSETVQSTGRRQELRVGGQSRGAGVWRVYLQMEMVNVSVEVRRIVVGTAWRVRTLLCKTPKKAKSLQPPSKRGAALDVPWL